MSNVDLQTNELQRTLCCHLFRLYYLLEQLGTLFETLPLALKKEIKRVM